MKCLGWILQIFLFLQVQSLFAFPENGTIPEFGEKSASDTIVIPKDVVILPQPSDQLDVKHDSLNELAILQHKLIPKRNRIDIGLAYGRLIDNAFFDTQTYYGRIGYSVFETWALELSGFSADAKPNRASDAASAVVSVPSGYFGLDVKWSPIYGKVAFWNSSINPIEQFFILGGGNTQLTGMPSTSTFHAGTGISFGIYSWLAARAELEIFDYSVKGGVHHTDTHMSLGFSTFYPKADFR